MRKLISFVHGAMLGLALLFLVHLFHHSLMEGKTMRQKSLWWGLADIALLIILARLLLACRAEVVLRSSAEPKEMDSAIVAMTPLVQNNLDFFYFAVAEKANLEGSFCMIGFVDEHKHAVLVQRLIPVWIDSADGSNMVHRPAGCEEKGVIGSLHFHPGVGYCAFSDTDIRSAHLSEKEVTGIVCRPAKDSLPKLILAFRKDYEDAYAKLKPGQGTGNSFTATYRYQRVASKRDVSTDSLCAHAKKLDMNIFPANGFIRQNCKSP